MAGAASPTPPKPAGNLVYRKTSRNFGPVMATAARTTIAQVARVMPVGELDPEVIITPGIYIDRLVEVPLTTHDGQETP